MHYSTSIIATAACLPPGEIQIPYRTAREYLLSGAYKDIWSEGRFLAIRGSVNKAPRVLKAIAGIHSEEAITCDVDELDFATESYRTAKQPPPGCGFKTYKAFYTWWSNYRSFCHVASGRRGGLNPSMTQDDDWGELMAHLTGRRGGPVIFGIYEMIPIATLARECRIRAIAIADLTAQRVAEFATSLPDQTIAAIKVSFRRLDEAGSRNCVPHELLPPMRIGELPELTPPDVRRVPPLHPEFAALAEAYVDERVRGLTEVFFGAETRPIETKKLSDDRAKNIRGALRWLWHGLVALGLASHEGPFDRSILTHPIIAHDLVEACSKGLLGPICDPETRRDRLLIVIAFLEWIEPGFKSGIDQKFFEDVRLTRKSDEESENRARKREICLEFIRHEALQHRFFSMPWRFFNDAKPLIANFNGLMRDDGNGISMEQHRALDLAIMAALTAINTRFPARLKTLVQLEAFGERPHLLFPDYESYFDTVVLDIPGYIVKNGRHASGVQLRPGKLVNPREILRWYLDEAHPLVLKYKPSKADLRRPDLLFAGLHIDTLRRIWRYYIVEAGLSITAHMCRHVGASLLKRQGVPIEEIAELLCISVKVAEETYTFVEKTLLIQNTMDAQAKIFESLGV